LESQVKRRVFSAAVVKERQKIEEDDRSESEEIRRVVTSASRRSDKPEVLLPDPEAVMTPLDRTYPNLLSLLESRPMFGSARWTWTR
jgi:hypothetical protein